MLIKIGKNETWRSKKCVCLSFVPVKFCAQNWRLSSEGIILFLRLGWWRLSVAQNVYLLLEVFPAVSFSFFPSILLLLSWNERKVYKLVNGFIGQSFHSTTILPKECKNGNFPPRFHGFRFHFLTIYKLVIFRRNLDSLWNNLFHKYFFLLFCFKILE